MTIIKTKDYGLDKADMSSETLVNFILDESGSMEAVKAQTISGFNEYIQTLKKSAGDVHVTLAKFNSNRRVEVVYSNRPVSDVGELNSKGYQPDGLTPLYDAIGQTVRDAEKATGKGKRVLIIIQTDGLENASTEYGLDAVKALIQEKEGEGNWTFVYLGANQDAWGVGGQVLGLHVGNVMSYDGDATKDTFNDVASSTVSYCIGQSFTTRKFFGR